MMRSSIIRKYQIPAYYAFLQIVIRSQLQDNYDQDNKGPEIETTFSFSENEKL